MSSPRSLDRRTFLRGSASVGLLVPLLGPARLAWARQSDTATAPEPSLFVRLDGDETVWLTCHRAEMGQQIWTAMAQLLADELDADWRQVRIVQATGHPRYGDQNTDGSWSVRQNFERLRLAGAAYRALLIAAAAGRWRVRKSALSTEPGHVVHAASGRKLSFGSLAGDAVKQKVPDHRRLELKDSSRWRYIARSMPSLTTPTIVEGKGVYGIDVRLPNMLHAVVARPPTVLGRLEKVDTEAALAVPGVEKTVILPTPTPPLLFKPLGGVAVIARDTWSAIRGREALRATWVPGPNENYESTSFRKQLLAAIRRGPGEVRRNRGDVYRSLDAAHKTVKADYYVPHLAHAPMEPPAVAARWSGDRVELWGAVQAPQRARKAVADACGVDPDNVTVHVTWLGGAFGRKSLPDFFCEAALIARSTGAPVKLTWTREDDLRHGYYHTVSAQRLVAGLDERGRCTSFLHRTVFPPIQSTFVHGADSPTGLDLTLGASDTPFDVPHLRLESARAPAHLRIGWLRSVGNIYHAFAVQSFASELAHAAGRDPLQVLLELIGPPRTVDPPSEGAEYTNYGSSPRDYPIDTARLAHVARRAGELSGWGRRLPPGHGLGIAAHRSFASYVGTVVEVAVDSRGSLEIPGVWSVIDAGTVINPDHVRQQLEGGTLFGLSNALFGAITARAGRVLQRNFPDFRVMRMGESPRTMETEIVRSTHPPGGVGEPPTPPAAPALTNAIFAATGVRIRELPIFDSSRKDRIDLPSRQRTRP